MDQSLSFKKGALVLFILSILLCHLNLSAQDLDIDGDVRILDMERVTTHPANVIRNDDGVLAIKQLQIGDFAHGGLVFYVDPSGEHGLVADTLDLAADVIWADTALILGLTGRGVLQGYMNSAIALAALRTISSAVRSCYEHSRNGYSDWFLPSSDELALMNSELHMNGLGNFQDDEFYWSSSELSLSFDFVLAIRFGSIGLHSFGKTSQTPSVRAIRRF